MSRALAVPAKKAKLPARLKAKLKRAVMAWLKRLEPHTERSYRRGLVHFAEWLSAEGVLDLPEPPKLRSPERAGWEDEAVVAAGNYLLALEPPDPNILVQAYLEDLVYPSSGKAYTRSTANIRLAALRWMVREARLHGKITWSLEANLPKAKKGKSGRLQNKAGRNMEGPTRAQVKQLLDAAYEDEDARAWLIMSFLRHEGYREHEIRQLNYEEIDLRRRTATMVRKKRDKPQAYPLSKNTLKALKTWLKIRGREPGPLLYGGHKGKNPERRIGETTIYFIVQRIGETAGLSTSPHKIRHRACTDIVQNGIKRGLPEEEILFLTGHSSRAALQPYYEASKSRKSARQVLDSLDELLDEDMESQ